MIVSSRVDSRLIHGQVLEAWVPHLKLARLVVADDSLVNDPLATAAMTLAVPSSVEVVMCRVDALDARQLAADSVRTLILFRDVEAFAKAREGGLPDGLLTLGNVHAGAGRTPISRTVYLSPLELEQLRRSGMKVVAQAVPAEKPLPLD